MTFFLQLSSHVTVIMPSTQIQFFKKKIDKYQPAFQIWCFMTFGLKVLVEGRGNFAFPASKMRRWSNTPFKID